MTPPPIDFDCQLGIKRLLGDLDDIFSPGAGDPPTQQEIVEEAAATGTMVYAFVVGDPTNPSTKLNFGNLTEILGIPFFDFVPVCISGTVGCRRLRDRLPARATGASAPAWCRTDDYTKELPGIGRRAWCDRGRIRDNPAARDPLRGLLLFGGFYALYASTADHAASEAARYASIRQGSSNSAPYPTEAEVAAMVNADVLPGFVPEADISLTKFSDDPNEGDRVTVTIRLEDHRS